MGLRSFMTQWIYLFLAISGMSLVGIIVFLVRVGSLLEQFKALKKKEDECPINDVNTQVKIINTKLDIFLKSMSVNIADALREHNKLERDTLIDKMTKGLADQSELHRLATLLRNDFVEDNEDYPNVKTHKLALANLMAVVDVKIKEGTIWMLN
jgi:hypothetical protein